MGRSWSRYRRTGRNWSRDLLARGRKGRNWSRSLGPGIAGGRKRRSLARDLLADLRKGRSEARDLLARGRKGRSRSLIRDLTCSTMRADESSTVPVPAPGKATAGTSAAPPRIAAAANAFANVRRIRFSCSTIYPA
jgi:hypothetical protein